MTEQIRRVAVWGGWLRLAHWAMAGAAVLLIVTGWLIANSPALANAASDVHFLGASVLVFALSLRLVLGFFGNGADRFEHMLSGAAEIGAMRDSLVFYLSLGRAPLPNWYAHNPLWKPVYLLLIALLMISAATGWLMQDHPLVWRFYLPAWHEGLATAISILTLLHVISVGLQDARGGAADVSAMINGYRYFKVDRDSLIKPQIPQVSIRLDDIERR